MKDSLKRDNYDDTPLNMDALKSASRTSISVHLKRMQTALNKRGRLQLNRLFNFQVSLTGTTVVVTVRRIRT